jgi:hypothetical protein
MTWAACRGALRVPLSMKLVVWQWSQVTVSAPGSS